MKRTEKYKFPYFEEGDMTTSLYEIQRWTAIDTQLHGLFSLFGNGVISGWDIVLPEKLTAKVSKGSGVIDFISIESKSFNCLKFPPNSTSHVYASIVPESYWNKTAKFAAYSSKMEKNSHLYLASVETDKNSIVRIHTEGRKTVGVPEEVIQKISEHKHSGGLGKASKIDLSKEVEGELPQECMPELDADMVKTGVFDTKRLPEIDHNSLKDSGTITHDEIENFIGTISEDGCLTVGQTIASDMLRTSLLIKQKGYSIDEKTRNQILYVPGIEPSPKVDLEKTTVTVDENSISASCNGDKKYFYTEPISVGKDTTSLLIVSNYSTEGSASVAFSIACGSGCFDSVELGKFVEVMTPHGTITIKIEISGDGSAKINDFAMMYC
jgi:hypothetical protein